MIAFTAKAADEMVADLTVEQLRKRAAELEATPRTLVASDEGTHNKPRTYRVWQEITGEVYATTSFGNANATRCTYEEAEEGTAGRINHFQEASTELRHQIRELEAIRRRLAKLKK